MRNKGKPQKDKIVPVRFTQDEYGRLFNRTLDESKKTQTRITISDLIRQAVKKTYKI